MSMRRTDYGATFEINVGSAKTFKSVIEDDDGNPLSMTNTTTYNAVEVKILKPDGTQVGATITGSFSDRPNGEISFLVTATHSASANAGNWKGIAIFKNSTPEIIDQRFFNFNIIEV